MNLKNELIFRGGKNQLIYMNTPLGSIRSGHWRSIQRIGANLTLFDDSKPLTVAKPADLKRCTFFIYERV